MAYVTLIVKLLLATLGYIIGLMDKQCRYTFHYQKLIDLEFILATELGLCEILEC